MSEESSPGARRWEVDFFVSYAGRDRAWAEWVAWHVQEAGFTVELAAWDWAAGENFVTRMSRVLDAAGRVIAVLTPTYFEEDRYTNEEWSSAVVKAAGGQGRLVPVQVERFALPRMLAPLLRVELFDLDEAAATRELLAAVTGPRRPDGAPVFPGRGAPGTLSGRGEAGPRLPGVLPAVWNIGPRNPGFVGREGVLDAVRERLRSGGAAVVQALHGMGGIGKTQLATEYAYRHGGAYDVAWWVNADEAGLIGEQYAALAVALGLAGPQVDVATAVGAVHAYLRGHDRWLVVFDNAESAAAVREWLPAGPGHVLITSRNPGWGGLAERVEVDLLTRAESVALLHAYRPDLTDASRLAEALGDLPLALAQAGGYLAENGMPVGDYLRLLAEHAGELLGEGAPDAHPHSLAAAILLSTDALARVDPSALALVRAGAFLGPDPIPVDLLTGQVPATGDGCPPELRTLATVTASAMALNRSLARIGRYGLAHVDNGIQFHRLTQAVLRDQLTADQAAAYRAHAEALLGAFDSGGEEDPANWPLWSRILPHLLAVDPANSPNPELRDLALRAPWYLWSRGESAPAQQLAEHLHRRWSELHGPDDPHALSAGINLVRLTTDRGPEQWVRDLGEDVVSRSRRVLGADHPETLRAAQQLANCLHEMGAFEQARELNEDGLARRRRLLGDDHLDTQRSAHNLARDLRALGELETARDMHAACLEFRRRVLGDDHVMTIRATNELGMSLRAVGDAEAARKLHETGLETARRMVGEDHMLTLEAANELGRDLHALGDVRSARTLSDAAYLRSRRVFGDGSYFTMNCAKDLAADLLALGEFERARRLAAETLTRARRAFGDAHPIVTSAAEIIASAEAAND